jgi:4,5-DOPA dioxygenase extradiol
MTYNAINIVYFSHGGGPMPILGDPGHLAMIDFMADLPKHLPEPEAILVISAHWEQAPVTVMGSALPPMFYDYYGFPPAAYEIKYPAPGSPALAEQIVTRLSESNIPVRIDPERGFDHGLFIPLNLMYPQADIPAIQLSLHTNLSPETHLELGRSLNNLPEINLLVIGSGFSFHNMSAFFHHDPDLISPRNDAFQEWLIDVITSDIPQVEREERP